MIYHISDWIGSFILIKCPLESGIGLLKAPPIRMLHFLNASNQNAAFLKIQYSDWSRLRGSDSCSRVEKGRLAFKLVRIFCPERYKGMIFDKKRFRRKFNRSETVYENFSTNSILFSGFSTKKNARRFRYIKLAAQLACKE